MKTLSNQSKDMKKKINTFTYSAGRNPSCPKCFGKGFYAYDENHSQPCELCCPHDQGFWKLPKDYKDAGKMCCRLGCGYVK